jgi:hypothetical protein
MGRIQLQIIELFQTLTPRERWEMVARLLDDAPARFYDSMSPEQRLALEQSIAEADRGEGRPAEEVFARLAEKIRDARTA